MSWRIRLRSAEACDDQPFLTPDLIVKVDADGAAYLDFELADGKKEPRNRGGLRSREALQTAILIQLFSDARARDDDILPDDLDPNRRGWWGDGVDRAEEQGAYDLGSRLWLLRRSPLTIDTAARARDMVIEALQPIVDQGAVASFDVECESFYQDPRWGGPERGILAIGIRGYARDGAVSYDEKFEVLWDQVREMRGQRTSFTV